MTEPHTAEEFAVAMQRDNSLTPMQWIRKAMLQAYREAGADCMRKQFKPFKKEEDF
jgi:hypothetical protein